MAVKQWSIRPTRRGTMIATITMDGGDTSTDINMQDFPDKTIHIFGTFGNSTVSLVGLNDTDGNGQVLHRTDDPTATFSAVGAELMAHVIENPYIFRASASAGTGTDLTISIVGAASGH